MKHNHKLATNGGCAWLVCHGWGRLNADDMTAIKTFRSYNCLCVVVCLRGADWRNGRRVERFLAIVCLFRKFVSFVTKRLWMSARARVCMCFPLCSVLLFHYAGGIFSWLLWLNVGRRFYLLFPVLHSAVCCRFNGEWIWNVRLLVNIFDV